MKPSLPRAAALEVSIAAHEPDSRWRSLIAQGNVSFRAGHMDEALAFYLDGFVEAERLLRMAACEAGRTGVDPAEMLVIAASNAGNVHMDRGNHRKAQETLQCATALLRASIKDETAPVELRMTCVRNMNPAINEVLAHMRRAGAESQAMEEEFKAAKQVAFDCIANLKSKHFH
ncbi:MAG: hypothetical protein ACFB0Z_01565 [Candidatus Phaeomarinobacter sp.]